MTWMQRANCRHLSAGLNNFAFACENAISDDPLICELPAQTCNGVLDAFDHLPLLGGLLSVIILSQKESDLSGSISIFKCFYCNHIRTTFSSQKITQLRSKAIVKSRDIRCSKNSDFSEGIHFPPATTDQEKIIVYPSQI